MVKVVDGNRLGLRFDPGRGCRFLLLFLYSFQQCNVVLLYFTLYLQLIIFLAKYINLITFMQMRFTVNVALQGIH